MIANGQRGSLALNPAGAYEERRMATLEKLNVGIVGSCSRGGSFQASFAACSEARVHAVCDLDAGLPEAARAFEASEQYTDYQQMLSHSDLDAVVIATPMPLHAAQSIMALQEGLHVLSEVTAAVSVEEARDLVLAAHASDGIYMLAENCNYFITNMIVTQLVRRGLFGTTYFADGEYLHNVKNLAERTPWRRSVQLGIDGITYGTHSLGPMLQWLPGDRVASVCCAGSGHHYQDPRGDDYHQDTSLMLGKMVSGGLIKLRVDLVSLRPHLNCTYQLQGTRGCYESARTPTGQHRVWLSERCDDPEAWMNLSDLQDEFLPQQWRQAMGLARGAGHGGSDYFVIHDFIQAVISGGPSPIGVHEAMDMTLPGLISQQSIAVEGQWMEVPDSRDWVTGAGT